MSASAICFFVSIGNVLKSPLCTYVCENDDNKHLCAWSLGVPWKASQDPERLSCPQIPSGKNRA